MERIERQDDDVAAIRQQKEDIGLNIRSCTVGIVESYDPDAGTAVVQPAIREYNRTPDGGIQSQTLPMLTDVPIMYLHAGPFTITYPVKKGDEVLLLFGDRCFDAWHQSGGIQEQVESRLHDLSNAFAIPGLFSKTTMIKNADPDNLHIRHNDGDCYIEITPSKDMTIKAKNLTLDIEGLFLVKAGHMTGQSQ